MRGGQRENEREEITELADPRLATAVAPDVHEPDDRAVLLDHERLGSFGWGADPLVPRPLALVDVERVEDGVGHDPAVCLLPRPHVHLGDRAGVGRNRRADQLKGSPRLG